MRNTIRSVTGVAYYNRNRTEINIICCTRYFNFKCRRYDIIFQCSAAMCVESERMSVHIHIHHDYGRKCSNNNKTKRKKKNKNRLRSFLRLNKLLNNIKRF